MADPSVQPVSNGHLKRQCHGQSDKRNSGRKQTGCPDETTVRISPITNKSPKCQVNVLGSWKEALVDSGADISVVQIKLLSSLPRGAILKRYKLKGPKKCVSASGHDLGPDGQVTFRFALGGKQFTHTFLVVKNLHTGLILGDDFLAQKGAKIDFKNRVMYVKGGKVRLTPRGPMPEVMEEEGEGPEEVAAVNMAYGTNPSMPSTDAKKKDFSIGLCLPKEKERQRKGSNGRAEVSARFARCCHGSQGPRVSEVM